MVDALEPYVKEIADIKKNLPNILREILIRRKDDVIAILKDKQLSKGLDSSGKVVDKYKPVTEHFYAKQDPKPRTPKQAGKPYNFEWSGGFMDGFDMMFEDLKSFSLFSKDAKAEFLNSEYGNLDTLTKQNNERVNNEILRPEMFEEIIKRLFY